MRTGPTPNKLRIAASILLAGLLAGCVAYPAGDAGYYSAPYYAAPGYSVVSPPAFGFWGDGRGWGDRGGHGRHGHHGHDWR